MGAREEQQDAGAEVHRAVPAVCSGPHRKLAPLSWSRGWQPRRRLGVEHQQPAILSADEHLGPAVVVQVRHHRRRHRQRRLAAALDACAISLEREGPRWLKDHTAGGLEGEEDRRSRNEQHEEVVRVHRRDKLMRALSADPFCVPLPSLPGVRQVGRDALQLAGRQRPPGSAPPRWRYSRIFLV